MLTHFASIFQYETLPRTKQNVERHVWFFVACLAEPPRGYRRPGQHTKREDRAVHNAENTRSLADVHDSIKSAVVTIELPDGSSGSGFAVRADGILATNQHVIAGHTKARVSFVDGNDTDAQVVQSFRDVDLAFLLTEEPLSTGASLT